MRIVTIVLALMMTGCAGAGIAAVSGPVDINKAYTVTLEREWNMIADSYDGSRTRGDRLTQDGPSLNVIYLVGALQDGDHIIKPRRKEFPTPTYQAGMSELELVEFVTDTLSAYGYERVTMSEIAPAPFGSADGIALGISAVTARGLKLQGNALLAEAGGGLNVMVFIAPQAHYYGAYKAEVAKIFRSADMEVR